MISITTIPQAIRVAQEALRRCRDRDMHAGLSRELADTASIRMSSIVLSICMHLSELVCTSEINYTVLQHTEKDHSDAVIRLGALISVLNRCGDRWLAVDLLPRMSMCVNAMLEHTVETHGPDFAKLEEQAYREAGDGRNNDNQQL